MVLRMRTQALMQPVFCPLGLRCSICIESALLYKLAFSLSTSLLSSAATTAPLDFPASRTMNENIIPLLIKHTASVTLCLLQKQTRYHLPLLGGDREMLDGLTRGHGATSREHYSPGDRQYMHSLCPPVSLLSPQCFSVDTAGSLPEADHSLLEGTFLSHLKKTTRDPQRG